METPASASSILVVVYQYCALLGGAFLVIQFLLMLFGFFGDSDVDTGSDVDVDTDTDADVEADTVNGLGTSLYATFVQYLTLRSIVVFTAFFGLMGLWMNSLGLPVYLALGIAVVTGMVASVCIVRVMKLMSKLNAEGNTNYESAVGKTGHVYVSIAPQRQAPGKIQLVLHGHTEEMEAVTDGERLATGEIVVIRELIEHRTALVEKAGQTTEEAEKQA